MIFHRELHQIRIQTIGPETLTTAHANNFPDWQMIKEKQIVKEEDGEKKISTIKKRKIRNIKSEGYINISYLAAVNE